MAGAATVRSELCWERKPRRRVADHLPTSATCRTCPLIEGAPILDIAALSSSRTVPRTLVHRAAVSEVFLTDWARVASGKYAIAAQLPRVHAYYSDHITAPASYDPLLLLEVFRQASILVAHEFLEAPLDSRFIFVSGALRITDLAALRIGAHPGHVSIEALQTGLKHRDEAVTGSTLDMVLAVDGGEAATMRTVAQWLPPAAWDKLREKGRSALVLSPPRPHHTGRRLVPVTVGRTSPQNVVLSAVDVRRCGVTAQIIVDRTNPALFDHPIDHIPGVLIFEAYRQTAVYAAQELFGLSPRGLLLSGVEAEFTRFGEFELPTDCRAEVAESPAPDTIAFDIALLQEEDQIARARVELTRTSPISDALLNLLHTAAA